MLELGNDACPADGEVLPESAAAPVLASVLISVSEMESVPGPEVNGTVAPPTGLFVGAVCVLLALFCCSVDGAEAGSGEAVVPGDVSVAGKVLSVGPGVVEGGVAVGDGACGWPAEGSLGASGLVEGCSCPREILGSTCMTVTCTLLWFALYDPQKLDRTRMNCVIQQRQDAAVAARDTFGFDSCGRGRGGHRMGCNVWALTLLSMPGVDDGSQHQTCLSLCAEPLQNSHAVACVFKIDGETYRLARVRAPFAVRETVSHQWKVWCCLQDNP